MDQEVPIFVPGSTPSLEDVGTGDGSNLVFYFDNNNIISDSETIYTGSVAESGATTVLTRGTDYVVDEDNAKLTLVSPAQTTVGTNKIFAKYLYNKFGIKDSRITDALTNAEKEVDRRVNCVFTDDTVSAPSFVNVLNEEHQGGGDWLRIYHTEYYPLNPVQALVSGAVSSGASTFSVTSTTDGFANSGYVGVGSLKVSYTGKTSSSFTGCSGITSAIVANTKVTNWIVERSLTTEGTEPSWEVLSYESDYDIDASSGEVKLNRNAVVGTILFDSFQPNRNVWNRVRFTYNYGYDNIPSDIVRAVHLLAGKELFNSQVLNALGRGTNGFSTDSINNSDEWVKDTIMEYKCFKYSNLNN